MPGINFTAAREGAREPYQKAWTLHADAVRRALPHVECAQSAVSDGVFSAFTYAKYPLVRHASQRWVGYVEGSPGRSFDAAQLMLFEKETWSDDDLRRCWDRDFSGAETLFLLAYDKLRRRLWFVNDGLSRLPVYYAAAAGNFAIGRDYRTVLLALPEPAIDHIQLAFVCLFQFPINERLPHRDMRRLSPASIGFFDFNHRSLHVSCDWNHVKPAIWNGGSFAKRTKEAVELFLATTKQQCAVDADVVLSLSAGLDSRAVGAALQRNAVPFRTATFELMDGTNKADVAGAAKIARVFGTPHSTVEISEPSVRDYEDLFTLKWGLNYLEMGTILPFLRAVRDHSAPPLVLTGANGNPVMQNVSPSGFRELEEIVDFTMLTQSVFPVEDVEGWFGLPSGTMRDYVREIFRAYPPDEQHPFRNFTSRERNRAYVLEGEDRDRCYAATDTPFMGRAFYELGVSMPSDWKAGDKFCRAFLAQLSPEMSRIVNPSTYVAPASPLYPAMLQIKPHAVRLRRRLFGLRLKGKMKPLSGDTDAVRRIRELALSDSVRSAAAGLAAAVSEPRFPNRPRAQQMTIYTVLALLNDAA